MSKKYIWEKEIKKINWNNVTFTDDIVKYYSDIELKHYVSDEPKDETAYREKVLDTVSSPICDILDKYNVRKGDLQAIIQQVISTYNHTFNIAVWQAFWTFEEWQHSSYFPENIRVSDIKKVKQI